MNASASGYRLPTEAEWEYAARGGNNSPGGYTYAGSNDVNAVAWYGSNSGGTYHEVGTKAANGLGLYDMSGNGWEWCWDWYGGYSSGAQTNPVGASSGTHRVWRGGSWYYAAQFARSADRDFNYPSYRGYLRGFRLVCP
jgi:formylglycine-generating enzyme required for sulfatase activity